MKSGRKKGCTPWNKGKKCPWAAQNGFKKGQTAWNKGKEVPSISKKMMGNTNGSGNKGRKFSPETLKKMSLAKLGKPSGRKGKKLESSQKEKMSLARRSFLKRINPDYEYNMDSSLRAGNKRIRRERLKLLEQHHTEEEWESLKREKDYSCVSCLKKEPEIKLTRDHIIPLSCKGKDDITNIQPLCNSCNAKKATKPIKF